MSSPPSSSERSHSFNDDWIYTFPRYRLEDELDTDDPFCEFMDETKYRCEEEASEEESGSNEEEEEESDRKTKTVIIWVTKMIIMVMTRATRLVLLNM